MLRQYTDGERERHVLRGVVTGKDVRIGGSQGRTKATGQGVAYCVDDWFQDRELSLKGAKIIVQGFGNVGSFAAEILSGMGAKIIAVQDADGSIFNPNGLDVGALMTYVYENKENLKKSVAGFPGGESLGRDDFWSVECDVCIPAALGNVINGEVAERMRCKLVAEGANHPTTPDADEVFLKRGIDLIPDVIANAGGVTVSYYEWVQNKRMEQWTEAEVNTKLERAIRSNYRIIRDIAGDRPRRMAIGGVDHDSRGFTVGKKISPRAAAMVLALKRIEAHYRLEGFSQ
jgi:glutamate dehydrogenase (NAD(P)+)